MPYLRNLYDETINSNTRPIVFGGNVHVNLFNMWGRGHCVARLVERGPPALSVYSLSGSLKWEL